MNTTPPNPTRLFHITSIQNLPNILESGELLSKSMLDRGGTSYVNIAHNSIQERRNKTQVPITPYGTLPDYIPFSFAPRSPMLGAISQGEVKDSIEVQENIIHIVTHAHFLEDGKVSYVFTNGHAIMQPTEFFDSIDDIDKVDWEIFFEKPLMGGYSKYWNSRSDRNDKPKWTDRQRRREAEFLVHKRLPWNFVKGIATINKSKQLEIEDILRQHNVNTHVGLKPSWYY